MSCAPGSVVIGGDLTAVLRKPPVTPSGVIYLAFSNIFRRLRVCQSRALSQISPSLSGLSSLSPPRRKLEPGGYLGMRDLVLPVASNYGTLGGDCQLVHSSK